MRIWPRIIWHLPSTPAIELTSLYFATSRGGAISNVEYYPRQFEKVRDEANGATRYNFGRGGLAFLIMDKPVQTKSGVISRLGMIREPQTAD
jgi:hypothetical protein